MFSNVGLKMGEAGGNKNIQSSDVVGYLVAETCLTLYNLMDCSPPGSSVRGIPQDRILEWVAIFFSWGSS